MNSIYGFKWLKTSNGIKWLKSSDGRKWLNSVNSRKWLKSDESDEWLESLDGKLWYMTPECKATLFGYTSLNINNSYYEDDIWFYSYDGLDILKKILREP